MGNLKNGCFAIIIILLIGFWGIKSCFPDVSRAQESFELGKQALTEKSYLEAINYFYKIPKEDPLYKHAQELIAFARKENNAEDETNHTTITTEEAPPPIARKTEDEYLEFYQAKWDAIQLTQQGNYPRYKTYWDELGSTLEEVERETGQDPSLTRLKKLEAKLSSSKKLSEARNNYITYGDASYGQLAGICESYLQENLNDPESMDIQYRNVDGQTKKGWKVSIKYRATNGFGALVLQQSTFDVRFNMLTKEFFVADIH